MKRYWMFALVGALGLALVGCSTGGMPGSAGTAVHIEDEMPADDAIRVEDIDWSMDIGVENGMRRVMFSFTNNSDYTIVGLELDSAVKEDAAWDDLQAAFDYLVEDGADEQTIRDCILTGESCYAVKPGEASDPDACNIGFYYVLNIEQIDYVEPDMLTIKFLSDGKMYEEYYDYRNDAYSLSSDVVEVLQWSDSEQAAELPRPEDLYVIDLDDSGERFTFDTIATSRNDFEAYVAACKEAGFTANASETDDTYYADNEDGAYHLDLFYMNGKVSAYMDPIGEESE